MREFVTIDLLSERYRRLIEDVIGRLPHGWNVAPGEPPKRVTFVETAESPEKPTGLAHTQYREDSPYRRSITSHIVVLYTRNLSECTDDVVRWVIAHEFGHVVSSHLGRSASLIPERVEDIADSLAMGWGFAREWEAWAAWNTATQESIANEKQRAADLARKRLQESHSPRSTFILARSEEEVCREIVLRVPVSERLRLEIEQQALEMDDSETVSAPRNVSESTATEVRTQGQMVRSAWH